MLGPLHPISRMMAKEKTDLSQLDAVRRDLQPDSVAVDRDAGQEFQKSWSIGIKGKRVEIDMPGLFRLPAMPRWQLPSLEQFDRLALRQPLEKKSELLIGCRV